MPDVSELTAVVAYVSLIGGTLCIVGGVWAAWKPSAAAQELAGKAKTAVAATATSLGPKTDEELKAQGAINDTIESMAKLASSLKDLDVGSRFAVLGVTLYAIAAVAAGLDAVAQGIAAT